ncbi:MAG: AmmeMemoRadiSam system protein A [Alphaproteobacteria bacterium]|nr:AmmeMemoRadiSam system protein A [Alphaproteobacteria bacterium]
MSIFAAVAVPHPPIIFEEVGHGREQEIIKTINAYREAMKVVAAYEPDTIILTTPHSELYADYFHIAGGAEASGDFTQFGAPQVKIHAYYDQEFVSELEAMCKRINFPCGTLGERNPALDHGSIIPLRYLNEVWPKYKVVRIGLSGLSLLQHYQLGQLIKDVVNKLNRRAVFVASGDLSHRLLAEGPYGFAKEGPEFDAKITKALGNGDFADLFTYKPEFCEAAGECGHRSFIIMAGALDNTAVKSELLSYEGPFGVGYGVATFKVDGVDNTRNFGTQYKDKLQQEMAARRQEEDDFVSFARKCVEHYVTTGMPLEFPSDLPEELTSARAGVFVSLKKNGQLRGCIGTTEPVTENIGREIWRNAISACSQDPRFSPVRADELDDIVYSVDVLTPAKPVTPGVFLHPKVDGIIVQNGGRRGLLLPDLEGVDTTEQQIGIAKQKAGIAPDEPVDLFYFQVVRHF